MSDSNEKLEEDGFSESVEPGVWRYAMAERVGVIVDAEDYFAIMQQAMLNARKRIMLIGWDFDTRIHLAQGRKWYQRVYRADFPSRLGSFLMWLGRNSKQLDIYILKWGLSVVQFAMRGSMTLDILRMWPLRRIHFKFDTQHPIGCSHHQKIAVLDNRLSVCGGIDLTVDRWDTRQHREDEPGRTRPRGKPYDPWHDITVMLEGEISGALSDLCRQRWETAGGGHLEAVEPCEDSLWPKDMWTDFENVEVGIARTRAEYKGAPKIDEVETLMLKQIAEAKHFIYAENQYLTSRTIAEAIAKRLEEDDPPEIVIVHPKNAEGWLEQQAMDHARSMIAHTLRGIDHKNRFGLFVAYSGETPIYVHAKLMIVDDMIIRIGSANMNNRSMGLDSECDIFIDARREANAGAEQTIKRIRCSLLAEHCGFDEAKMEELLEQEGSMIAAIDKWGQKGRRQLRHFEIPELDEIEEGLANSELLDPEEPEDMFEPFAKGGLFRKGSRLQRAKDRLRKYRTKIKGKIGMKT